MKEKYDRIGKDYNRTRKADAYLTERLFHHLKPVKTGKYLDIGCGTGNYTIALNSKGLDLAGVEPSQKMLETAKARNSEVDWRKGRSDDLPFENEYFEGVLATLTIHHWGDLSKSFGELNRVLKSGGRFVIFTSTAEQMKGYWLRYYFPKMLNASIGQMPKLSLIEENLRKNGFEIIETEKYFVRDDLEDLFLYAGKNRPEIYLDKEIRRGISSFSDLGNAAEIEKGLLKLEDDIKSGKIAEIIKRFANDLGDYLFIVAGKAMKT